MTTLAAEALHLAIHQAELNGKPIAIYNPNDRPIENLPVIYGFNNTPSVQGNPFCNGCIIAEDGTGFGGHACTNEGYMYNDLGILEGCRPDRHETFRAHYQDGYRMEFVSHRDVLGHTGLTAAYEKNQTLAQVAKNEAA